MTRVLTIPGTISDTSLPIRRKDPRLFAGHLALIDPTTPATGFAWPAGVPADGALLPNLAQREARDVLANQAAEVRPVVSYPSSFVAPLGKMERTAKGGLHGITSQTTTSVAGAGFEIALPTALKTYLAATWDNARWISLYFMPTRASSGAPTATNAPLRMGITGASLPATNYTAYLKSMARRPTAPLLVSPAGNDAATLDLVGAPLRYSVATSGHSGTAPATFADLFAAVASFGRIGLNNSGIADTARVSWAFYGWSVCDLTVGIATDPRLAGKSPAEAAAIVDAVDLTAYTKMVATMGGRYNGDTMPTNPSTIP